MCAVALVLLYAAVVECLKVVHSMIDPREMMAIPFRAVIYLTLALAQLIWVKPHWKRRCCYIRIYSGIAQLGEQLPVLLQ
jgi:hypothetical protein